jgi:hypothetical protein
MATPTWVYLNSEPGLYTVGFYAPDGSWHTDSDQPDRQSASDRVRILNNGSGMTEYRLKYFRRLLNNRIAITAMDWAEYKAKGDHVAFIAHQLKGELNAYENVLQDLNEILNDKSLDDDL